MSLKDAVDAWDAWIVANQEILKEVCRDIIGEDVEVEFI